MATQRKPVRPARRDVWHGAVTGFAGPLLTGWVAGLEDAPPPPIRVLDQHDAVLATGLAERVAADGRGDGRAEWRFGVTLSLPDGPGQVRVLAGDTELAGSPMAVGPHSWDGALSLAGLYAEGWVAARARRFEPPEVRIYDQLGVLLASARARAAAATDGFRPARFRVRLPDAVLRHGLLHARAETDGQVFAVATIGLTMQGNLDEVTARRCVGWLYAPAAPTRRLRLEILRDGEVLAETVADRARKDLQDEIGLDVDCGFEVDLPPPARQETSHEISLRLAGTDCAPLGGPFVVGAQRDLVPALHRAAAAARQAGLDGEALAALQAAVALQAAAWRAAPMRPARLAVPAAAMTTPRLTVIIPVYRDVALTRACVDSVLRDRDARHDAVLLIDDASPEPGMAEMLARYESAPNVFVLRNAENLGFVGSVNKGLAFAREGDVVLLNSDTVIFSGGLAALSRVARAEPGVATVTPLSNAATLFSYPVPDQTSGRLRDVDFETLAAIALADNAGLTVAVPTGHGFCMLITRAALDALGGFDPEFGRGYGEENDFCRRAADMGLRNLAAAEVFVEHRESVSFTEEKKDLLTRNLARLETRFPEYAAEVRTALARDVLRGARWALDGARLARGRAAGTRHRLVVRNWLGGGTQQAIADMAAHGGRDGVEVLDLCALPGGGSVLRGFAPRLRAVFAEPETDALFKLLGEAAVEAIDVHQVLGFSPAFVAALRDFAAGRHCRVVLHDYYTLCPRVTMIDASGRFCGGPAVAQCERCVRLGGGHEADRMLGLSVARQRGLMRELLLAADRVVAPSASAAGWVRHAFAEVRVDVVPHPEDPASFQVPVRRGDAATVLLLGAIGPHKGADTLLAVARRARLVAPALRFVVVGYTSCDAALRAVGNVRITGNYARHELPGLIEEADGVMALFLHNWPETYSYTLSEAVRHGLVPVVPDIGAPAERVRAAGFGHVVAHPVDVAGLVALLDGLASGARPMLTHGVGPEGFAR